ncbi:hypothetical protein [Alkalilacustris brevis]|uniref:hypothetical protein n=1 Tax=Alkalilacustris brevis TaxID=2026338 RepID=UPI000E0CF672|nr:hypothetical protein [Alkalilacustris brevis]
MAATLPPGGMVWADATAHLFEKPVATSRDGNMNRQANVGGGAAGGGMAMANSVVVQQQGRGNTLILNVDQQNSGNISAGTSLNGRLDLD